MYEHNEPSEGFLVVNLSSDEEDVVPYTSRDEDLARKLFGDLNCGLLGPPDDNNVIFISNSEEEEVCEDDHADANAAPSSLRVSPTLSTSTPDNDDALNGVQDDCSDGGAPDRVQNDSSDGEDGADTP
jgi:hypothetical protein